MSEKATPIKVRAKSMYYYQDFRRREGDVFELTGHYEKDPETGKYTVFVPPEKEFSKMHMVKIVPKGSKEKAAPKEESQARNSRGPANSKVI